MGSIEDSEDEREAFENYLNMRGLSPRTIKEYLNIYYDNFGGKESFTQEYVDAYLGEKSFNCVCKAFLANYKAYLIRKYPDNNEFLRIQIMKQTGRKRKRIPKHITFNEMKHFETLLEGERNKIMFTLDFYTGIRRAGLTNIKINDFDWVNWKADKTKPCKLKVIEKGDKERVVFVPPFIMERIKNYIIKEKASCAVDDKLFNISSDRFYRIIKKTSEEKFGRRITPHQLRHGFATWLRSKGWDLQELAEVLGHEDIKTTMMYAHIDKEKLQSKYADLVQE